MIDYKLSKLSVLARAAKAYAGNDLSEIEANARLLYPNGKYPFVISGQYPLPLHLFSPRLTAMLTRDEDHMDAMEMWKRITARENIIRMTSASHLERTAAESLGRQFESEYGISGDPQNMKRKQMIGYMIKVVMECFGYLVYSSRMQVSTLRKGAEPEKRKSNYFTTATRYALMSYEDRDKLLALIDDEDKEAFESITTSILEQNTEYQKRYRINELSYWDSL